MMHEISSAAITPLSGSALKYPCIFDESKSHDLASILETLLLRILPVTFEALRILSDSNVSSCMLNKLERT